MVLQHGIGREQRREHHHVAQQEQPEAEAGDGLDRSRPALGVGDAYRLVGRVGEAVGEAHARPPPACCARARSKAAISSAGISISRSMLQAWPSAAAAMPISPTITSHQMCQIREKPEITAKKAMMTPTGVLR